MRFLTVDYWESDSAWEAFRSHVAAQFEDLDAKREQLITREIEIGRYFNEKTAQQCGGRGPCKRRSLALSELSAQPFVVKCLVEAIMEAPEGKDPLS